MESPESFETSSRRLAKTPAAIIDVLLEKYPDVRFNLAPGSPSATPNRHAISTCQAQLSDPLSITQFSRYDDVVGLTSLRHRWLEYIFGVKVSSFNAIIPQHEIMITAGANQAFVNVVLTICDPNDDVIVIVPYYFSHVNALLMNDVNPTLVKASTVDFHPRVSDIEKAITPNTRAVVLVNPGNPSGVTLPHELLDAVSELCLKRRIYLCIDEAYREYDFSRGDSISTAYSPRLHRYMIKIYTMSKAFGLAGWRVGALVYPRTLKLPMTTVQDTIPTHASLFSQALAEEALKYKPSHMESVFKLRNIFIQALSRVYPNTCLNSLFTGAFYFFLPYRSSSFGHPQPSSIGPRKDGCPTDDDDMVHLLAVNHRVLAVPGYAHGMDGYIRVCYGALRLEDAVEASDALAQGLINAIERYIQ